MTKKIFAVIMSVLMISCLFVTEVSALSEKTQDGLKAVITSDKTKYSTGEDINLYFELTNTNDFDVEMVSLTAQLPKGIKLKNERDNLISETQNLQKGKSLGLNLTVVEDNAKTPLSTEVGNNAAPQGNNNGSSGNSSGKTVDTGIKIVVISSIIVLFVISAILLFVFRKKKSTKNIISIMICSGMVFSALALLPVKTSAEEIRVMSFTVTDKIIVSDKEYEVSVLVGYNEIKKEEPDTEPATERATEIATEIPTEVPTQNQTTETLRLQKTGYIDGTLYYTHDQNFEYVNNSKVSMLPDNLKDKIGEFFVVDDYIYYIPTNLIGSDRYFNVDLRRIHFDGSGEELLANDLLYANSKCFYTNGGIVYISYNQENDESNVVYLNLETKEKTILPSEISHNFVVYGDKIYFSMGGLLNPKPDFSIMAYNLSDGTEEMILNSSSNLLFCNNGYLYYSERGDSESILNIINDIAKINLINNTQKELVLSEAEALNMKINPLLYRENEGGMNFDINNDIIYYSPQTYPNEGRDTAEIRAYDTNAKTDVLLSNVQAVGGIRKFKCENGYILYTVELEKDTPGSASLAGEYIFDIQNKTTELVSKYAVSSW